MASIFDNSSIGELIDSQPGAVVGGSIFANSTPGTLQDSTDSIFAGSVAGELLQSAKKSLATPMATIGNLIEGDPTKVDPFAVSMFGNSDKEWSVDEMGNMTATSTRDPEIVKQEQLNSPVTEFGRNIRKYYDSVKSGEYEKGSAASYAGAVIENVPNSLIYMLPHLVGLGSASSALMYQDSYLKKKKELQELSAIGKIKISEKDIEANASATGLAEALPETFGNSTEAVLIKLATRATPGLSALPYIGRFVQKATKQATGAALLETVFPTIGSRAAKIGLASLGAAPIEGATEYITERGLGSMQGQASLDLESGVATLQPGQSREDFIDERAQFAAVVGALSGSVVTGGTATAMTPGAITKANSFKTALENPIDAGVVEGSDTASMLADRIEAVGSLAAIIEGSAIPAEEKTNAKQNMADAVIFNRVLDLSSLFRSPAELGTLDTSIETAAVAEQGVSTPEIESVNVFEAALAGLASTTIEEPSIEEPSVEVPDVEETQAPITEDQASTTEEPAQTDYDWFLANRESIPVDFKATVQLNGVEVQMSPAKVNELYGSKLQKFEKLKECLGI